MSNLEEGNYERIQTDRIRKDRNNLRERARVQRMNSSLDALKNETRYLGSGEKVLSFTPYLAILIYIFRQNRK